MAEPQPQKTVEHIFRRMGGEFGHKFTSQMPTAKAQDTFIAVWAERLAGLTEAHLLRGFERLPGYAKRNRGWPPGAIEFRELCLPTYADFGMPEPDMAYHQACMRNYSHGAVVWAANQCRHEIDFQDARRARLRFAELYAEALEQARAGVEFPEPPEPPKQIGHARKPVLPPEEQARQAQKMRETLARANAIEPQANDDEADA